jgi:hypothetical protein
MRDLAWLSCLLQARLLQLHQEHQDLKGTSSLNTQPAGAHLDTAQEAEAAAAIHPEL